MGTAAPHVDDVELPLASPSMTAQPEVPTMSSIECALALQRAGFEIIALQEEHVLLRRENRVVSVARHCDLAPASIEVIVAAAGITMVEFLNLLSPRRPVSGLRRRTEPPAR